MNFPKGPAAEPGPGAWAQLQGSSLLTHDATVLPWGQDP